MNHETEQLDLEDLVGKIAEEFTSRLKNGEKPDAEEYVRRYPDVAESLRQILPALEIMGVTLDATQDSIAGAVHAPELEALGDYRIIREAGRGGMGVVYEAMQLSLHRRVALKVLPFAAVLDERQIKRFRNEALAAAQLTHPNIVDVYGVGCERSVHFYAMRFIEGETLASVIAQLRRDATPSSENAASLDSVKPRAEALRDAITRESAIKHQGDTSPMAAISTQRTASGREFFRSVARIGRDVASALDHAHEQGVIHRDIKPGNIILDATGKPWVTDFGLARIESGGTMTMTGDLIGTLRYMSPEQVLAKRVVVDHRTDIYSLGLSLYELLSLKPAYESNDRHELIRQISFEEPKSLQKHNRDIPEELETIVLTACAKNPSDRYATAQALADDLENFLDDKPIRAKRASLTQRLGKWCRRNRSFVSSAAAIAAVLLVTIAIAGFVVAFKERRIGSERVEINRQISAAIAQSEQLFLKASLVAEEKLPILQDAERWADRAVTLSDNWLADSELKERSQELMQQVSSESRAINELEVAKRDQAEKAREEWLPDIRANADQGNYVTAYGIARNTEQYVPNDRELSALREAISVKGSIKGLPGMRVEARDWRQPDGKWILIGEAPLENVLLPKGPVRWRFSLPGFRTMESLRVIENEDVIEIALDPEGQVPSEMVRVTPIDGSPAFLIDRFEVSNRDFQEFVDKGGYTNQEFWEELGENWKETITEMCRDRSGKTGPANWVGGRFPQGKADLPVTGISWHEANAFARFKGKSLPTISSWEIASNRSDSPFLLPLSNYSGKEPLPVGKSDGIGFYGVYDLAGNVKEWCLTPSGSNQNCVRGGSWADATYLFHNIETMDASTRSPHVGFRCVSYSEAPDLSTYAVPEVEQYGNTPVLSIEEIEQLKQNYRYDSTLPLNIKEVDTDDSSDSYIHEVVEIDAAYGRDRFAVHLFLPKGYEPPFQTFVYHPGTGSQTIQSMSDMWESQMSDWRLPLALIESGRAVCWPVLMGTFERQKAGGARISDDIYRAQDIFRSVDYLQTRSDIDMSSLAYFGFSWGGIKAPILSCLERRFSACVIHCSGLPDYRPSPEFDGSRFAPHVQIPVLMLNSENDQVFPPATSQQPLFELLGSKDKEFKTWKGGTHFVPIEEAKVATSLWLAERFGLPISTADLPTLSEEMLAKKYEDQARSLMRGDKDSEAELIIRQALELRMNSLGSKHRDTLRTRVLLAENLRKQGRHIQALDEYRTALDAQRSLLGVESEDAISTMQSIKAFCTWTAWNVVKTHEASDEENRTVVTLSRAMLDFSDQSPLSAYSIAKASYDLGDWEAADAAIKESFSRDLCDWPSQFLLMSMLQWQASEAEDARDWYWAANEWSRSTDPGFKPLWSHKALAAKKLQISDDHDAPESPVELLKIYDRLIKRHDSIGALYFRRGIAHAQLENWEDARTDFEKAIARNPGVIDFNEAHAALSLYLGDLDSYQSTCRIALENCAKLTPARVAFLCSLGDCGTDRVAILELAQSNSELNWEPNVDKDLALAVAKLRAGQVETAVDRWPSNAEPKDGISLLYRSIANSEVGNAYSSRKYLSTADRYIGSQLSSPNGPALHHNLPARPIYWCMLQIALKEAKELEHVE